MTDPLVNFDCPSCGQNLEAAEFNAGRQFTCPGCQGLVEVPGRLPQKKAAALATAPTHKRCPFCAEEIRSTAVKCKHCGEFLDGRKRITMSTSPVVLATKDVQTIEQTSKQYKAGQVTGCLIMVLSLAVLVPAVVLGNPAWIGGGFLVLLVGSSIHSINRAKAWWHHG